MGPEWHHWLVPLWLDLLYIRLGSEATARRRCCCHVQHGSALAMHHCEFRVWILFLFLGFIRGFLFVGFCCGFYLWVFVRGFLFVGFYSWVLLFVGFYLWVFIRVFCGSKNDQSLRKGEGKIFGLPSADRIVAFENSKGGSQVIRNSCCRHL